MENSQIMPATIKKRIIAFGIDAFVVYLLRFFYVNFAIQFWLFRYFTKFLKEYETLFGKIDFTKITNIEINFFLKSELFVQIKWFIVGLFIIPIIYNMCFLFNKWSATFGQKLMKIYVISKNKVKLKFYQIIARSILMAVPWILMFFIVLNQYLVGHKISISIDNTSLILFMIIFLSWYDVALLTKNKLVFHDYITLTRVVMKESKNYKNKKSFITRLFFFDFIDEFKKFKNNVKIQFKNAKKLKEKYKKDRKKK
ncbi:MAG TPA: RDD family protein [Rickettsiales bacterium]|nr:RDD family protein [Rickettsiales bacterium]